MLSSLRDVVIARNHDLLEIQVDEISWSGLRLTSQEIIHLIDGLYLAIEINNRDAFFIIYEAINKYVATTAYYYDDGFALSILQQFLALANHSAYIQRFINPELFEYRQAITGPSHADEFARLGLDVPDEFEDPIMRTVMNVPVKLGRHTYDLATLQSFSVNHKGKRTDPFTRAEFTIADVKPNKEIYRQMQAAITNEVARRRIVSQHIRAAIQRDDVGTLQNLYRHATPKIKLDDQLDNKLTALQYAYICGKTNVVQYLVEEGAEIDLTECSAVLPHASRSVQQQAGMQAVTRILMDYLRPRMAANVARAHYMYAKLLLTGEGVAQNVPQALASLQRAGEQGEIKGYMLCAEIFATGQYGTTKNPSRAIEIYKKAAVKYDSLQADIKAQLQQYFFTSNAKLEVTQRHLDAVSDPIIMEDADVAYFYSLIYGNGIRSRFGLTLLQQDSDKQIMLLQRAADLGSPRAQCEYACVFLDNDLIQNEGATVANYLRRAASQGFAPALLVLAHFPPEYFNESSMQPSQTVDTPPIGRRQRAGLTAVPAPVVPTPAAPPPVPPVLPSVVQTALQSGGRRRAGLLAATPSQAAAPTTHAAAPTLQQAAPNPAPGRRRAGLQPRS